MREAMKKCREAMAAKLRADVIRKGGNMTRTQANAVIASMLGVNPASLRNWEQGRTMPRSDKLLAMARLYDRPVEELLKEDR